MRLRLEAAHEHVAKQNDTIVQKTFDYEALQIQMKEVESQEVVKYLEGKVELYQFQVSIIIMYRFFSMPRLCIHVIKKQKYETSFKCVE